MALLVAEGFRGVNSSAELSAKTGASNQYVSFVSGSPFGKPSNGRYLKLATYTHGYATWGVGDKTSSLEMVVQWYGYYPSDDTPSTASALVVYGSGSTSTPDIILVLGAGGFIHAYRGTSILLGSSSAIPSLFSNWHYFEVKFKIDNSVGYVTVKMDGVTVLNLTSKDTMDGTDSKVSYVRLGANKGPDTCIASVVMMDTTGSYNNDFLGECIVEELFPNADSSVQFTRSGGSNNYEMIDEAPSPDSDTTYVYSSTDGHKDLYGFPDLEVDSDLGETLGVVETLLARKDDANAASIRCVAYDGANTSNGAEHQLGSSYTVFQYAFDQKPAAGAWSDTAVNGATFGFERVTPS